MAFGRRAHNLGGYFVGSTAKFKRCPTRLPAERMSAMKRSERSPPWGVWLFLGLILLVAFLIRWRMRECPLERDEGEYAYIGWLLLQGEAPYGVAGNHKFPGAYLAYAAIMALFGESVSGIHVGFLFVNLASTALVFFLGRRLGGNVAGLTTAAVWVVMSASPDLFGNAGHLTFLVMLAVLAGLAFLWRGLDRDSKWQIAAGGFCLGLSVVVRQTSLIFVAFGLVFIWRAAAGSSATTRQKAAGQAATFIAGSALPIFLMTLWLWIAGVFPQFWHWTVTGAAAYGSQVSLGDGLQKFLVATPKVIGWHWLIWAGAAGALLMRWRRDWFLVGFFLAGSIALLPGLYFREHYYVQILPPIALLFGALVGRGWDLANGWRYAAITGAALAISLPLVMQRNYFLESNPTALARKIYGGNPFPEAIEVARYIRENSEPTEPVAVLGSEPEIFFYSRRRSATTLIYSYPLLERHASARAMQETMAHEIEEKRPRFVVFVDVPTSWLVRSHSERFIFTWAEEFLPREYRLDGVADILAAGSQYVWGAAAADYQTRSPYSISVYRRTTD
jgi:hypothetical protein